MMSQIDPTITVWAGLALPPLLTAICAGIGAWREGLIQGATLTLQRGPMKSPLVLRAA